MKVIRLEFIEGGEYYILTEKELKSEYTSEEIESFKSNDMVIFYETKYTARQLNHARKKHDSESFCEWYEEKYNTLPTLFEVLEHFYN